MIQATPFIGFLIAVLACATTLDAQQLTASAKPAPAAAPVPAQSQPLLMEVNQHLPEWLRLSGEYRMRVEGVQGIGFRAGASDAYALSRLRLNIRVAPTRSMRFQFQAQDAQAMWRNVKPDAPPFEDTFDLRQAYMELGSAEDAPIALRVGRQELAFGEMRLIGHLNWTNTARSFDAARLTLQHEGYKVDVFVASVVNLREGTVNKSSGGNDLHGAYGSMSKVVPNAIIEPYVLWRIARGTSSEDGLPGLTSRQVYGTRFAGKLPMNLDYGIEVVGQTGSVGSDNVRALAGHWALGYTVTSISRKPRLVAEYNYGSGDEAPGDGVQETFDQLYPTGHDKLGLGDQVGWRNIHHLRAGVEVKPASKLSLAGSYHSWWLASTRDGLYNAGGALFARVADGSAGRHVGQEADIQLTYAIKPGATVGAGYSNLFPGTFLKRAAPGAQHRLPYVMLTYSF